MAWKFGPFELDEASRVVSCAGREVQLQPRVFDLLTYLVRNSSRVVSKEELLDAIWPNVIVTDNSLQRAVSALRAVLRQGDMESAVRNVPGKGYRFCIDCESEGQAISDPQVGGTADAAARARSAIAARSWQEACNLFEQVAAEGVLDGEDLHQWALALQCLGKPDAAIPVLSRAINARTRTGDVAQAATDAIMLADLYFDRGQVAIGKAWVARAEDWASETANPGATAMVLWMKSKVAAFEGEPEEALALAEAAYASVRHSDAVVAEALSLAFRGFYRLCLGDTQAGLSDQDQAATLALASNELDPVTGGILYCNVLWSARMFGDWARADQWTRGYQSFCSESGMELTGWCQLHRSEVLGIRGSLGEALARIENALSRLSANSSWAIGDAHRVLGDVQAAIGNDEEALEAYDKAYSLGWCPEPGRAMLLLERGEAEAAYAGLERSLIGKAWWTLQRRGILLAHLALLAAHTGRNDQAAELINELAGEPDRWPLPSIRALTNEAQAILALGEQDRAAAMRHLHLARQLWSSVEGKYQSVRLRLQIARLQMQSGDVRGARAEVQAAQMVAAEIGSHKLQAGCTALARDIQALRNESSLAS
jgi:DNA-binding winged helix-turn-helix (wHTH) protein